MVTTMSQKVPIVTTFNQKIPMTSIPHKLPTINTAPPKLLAPNQVHHKFPPPEHVHHKLPVVNTMKIPFNVAHSTIPNPARSSITTIPVTRPTVATHPPPPPPPKVDPPKAVALPPPPQPAANTTTTVATKTYSHRKFDSAHLDILLNSYAEHSYPSTEEVNYLVSVTTLRIVIHIFLWQT